MSEGVGPNIEDSSGNANDGTISGAAWTTGCLGSGLSFDGVDDYVDLGYAVGTDLDDAPAISLSAWIKADTLPAPDVEGNWVFGTRIHAGAAGFELLMNGANWQIGARSIVSDGVTSDGYQKMLFPFGVTGEWKHVVAIVNYETNSMTLYVDGSAQNPGPGTVTFLRSNYTRGEPTQTDRIGRSPADVGTFDGTIDEVRIYPRALTKEEVSALFAAGN